MREKTLYQLHSMPWMPAPGHGMDNAFRTPLLVVHWSFGEIPMRGKIIGLLAVALMSLYGVASANIVYNIDITDFLGGPNSVTGTITTDGDTGTLAVGDITAWTLTSSHFGF